MDQECLKQIIQSAITTITNPLGKALGDAISKAVCDSYNTGWNDCKRFYGIKDEEYLKED